MKHLVIFFAFYSLLSSAQDDELIYLTFERNNDTINLYCVNKNNVDYYIYIHIKNKNVVAKPNKLKLIVKANDSLFVSQLTSPFSLAHFKPAVWFYKKVITDTINPFKDFKTPTETLIKKDQLIVFTQKHCPECATITNYLNSNNFPLKQYDLHYTDNVNKFEDVLDHFNLVREKIELPFIVFEGKPYYHLKKKEKEKLLEEINEKLKSKKVQNIRRSF